MNPTPAIVTSYDPVLVLLSVAIAVFASYTALVVAGRIRVTVGVSHYLWLLGAGLLMGGGIWSMHFVGMLAFQMSIRVSYDLWLTLLSLLLPVVVTAAGFHIVVVSGVGPRVLAGAGLLMGFGMVAMHYTGMTAMRMPAQLEYQPSLVAASVLIAVAASVVALWLAFRLKAAWAWQKIGGAIAMGTAMAGMHYTAMAAAEFTADPFTLVPVVATALNPALLGIVITAASFVLLFLGLLAALFDRRYTASEPFSEVARWNEGVPSYLRHLDQYSPKFALLVIILFFVTVVGVVWGLAAWRDYSEAMEEVRVVTRNTARLVEEHVARAIGEGDLVVQHLIGLVDQLGLGAVVSSRSVWESVRRMGDALPHLGSVSILDAEGDLLFTTERFPAPEGRNFAEEPYFQSQKRSGRNELLVSEAPKERARDGEFFNVSRRLAGPDGSFAGVVLLVMRADYFTEFYTGLDLGSNSAIGIFREDGTVLTRHPQLPPGSGGDASRERPFRSGLGQAFAGTFENRSPLDGVERVVSYRRARNLPLVATASIAKEAALTEWRNRLHRNAVLGLVVAVTLGALSWLAVRSLQREELVANALRLAHDDLDRRVRERTAELESALADKEILFKEVHHRVKNNLQVICSLLNLQSGRFCESAVRQAFDEAYNRVYSISLVHKALYDQNAAAQIDFTSYLQDLCDSLSRLYGASARAIEIEVSTAESALDLNRAVPIALIVNEIISNALKHAFPEGRGGRIKIDFAARDSSFRLSIRDNGIGIPDDATQVPAKSLGLVIVNALAQQIDATATFRREAGTRFDLSSEPDMAEGADRAAPDIRTSPRKSALAR